MFPAEELQMKNRENLAVSLTGNKRVRLKIKLRTDQQVTVCTVESPEIKKDVMIHVLKFIENFISNDFVF